MTLSQEELLKKFKPKQLPFVRLSEINTVYLSTWLMKGTKKEITLTKKKLPFNDTSIKERWMQIY